MNGRRFPFGLMSATAAAMAWCLSQPHAAYAAPAPQRFDCPLSLPPGMVPTRNLPDGWNMTAPEAWAWRLDGSGMLHGAPDEGGYLIPASAQTHKSRRREISVRRWVLSTPHGYETWLYCGYGPVQLARRVPPTATECTVTVEVNREQRVSTAFVCR